MARKKLFVSFTGLMYALERGQVDVGDLADGLFAFGCTREHVFSPGAGGEYIASPVRENRWDLMVVQTAVMTAELSGRVVWRKNPLDLMSYEYVSKLLAANNCGEIETDMIRAWNGPYCYPGVTERVKEAGLNVDVIW